MQQTVLMRAAIYQLRGGKPVYRGQTFEVTPEEAAELIYLGWAAPVKRLAALLEAPPPEQPLRGDSGRRRNYPRRRGARGALA